MIGGWARWIDRRNETLFFLLVSRQKRVRSRLMDPAHLRSSAESVQEKDPHAASREAQNGGGGSAKGVESLSSSTSPVTIPRPRRASTRINTLRLTIKGHKNQYQRASKFAVSGRISGSHLDTTPGSTTDKTEKKKKKRCTSSKSSVWRQTGRSTGGTASSTIWTQR